MNELIGISVLILLAYPVYKLYKFVEFVSSKIESSWKKRNRKVKRVGDFRAVKPTIGRKRN